MLSHATNGLQLITPARKLPPAVEVRVHVYCGACGEHFIVIMGALLGRGTVPCVREGCEQLIAFSWGEYGAD